MRPSFEEIYMGVAEKMSQRSECERLQVGAVITSTDFRQMYACGYNGTASGISHDKCTGEEGACTCLHAEINLCINNTAPRYIDKYVFVTHLPCVMCAKALINLGNVKRIYFKTPYRDNAGEYLLLAARIELKQV